MSSNTTELFQEGLIIPPIPWMKEGKPVKASFDMVRYNVRIPETVLGDLEAQHAACMVGVRGYREMIESMGLDTITDAIEILFDQADRRMRAKIRDLPNGVYDFEDWVDSAKSETGRLPIKTNVEVKDDEIIVDFTGSAKQQWAPVNVNFAGTESGAHSIIKGMTDPDIPLNEGAVKAIKLIAPEGSIYNPTRPAPVALRGQIAQRAYDNVQGALAKALPVEEVVACPSGGNLVTSFGGVDTQGETYGSSDLTTGGIGARSYADGIDHVEHGFTNVQTTPSEAWEARYPIRVRDHELRTDSGGPGKFRGGLGIKRSFEILHGPVRSCHRHDRLLSSPWGYNGGMPGARWNCYIERANGTVEKLHSKQVIELQTGDVYVRETGGGGGWGDPLERDPQLVVEDVLDRKVSPRSAREDYGVVLLENNFEFDAQATIALRSELANERGPINWMFDHGEDGRR